MNDKCIKLDCHLRIWIDAFFRQNVMACQYFLKINSEPEIRLGKLNAILNN